MTPGAQVVDPFRGSAPATARRIPENRCHESRSWQSWILLGSGFSIFGGAPHRVRVSVGRRPELGLARCAGLRSGAAVREDAELIPLWVGKYDPALIALADVGVSST